MEVAVRVENSEIGINLGKKKVTVGTIKKREYGRAIGLKFNNN